MRKRRNFRKKPKDNSIGLSVTVFNNNVEGALKVLKRKVKDSNLFQDLRKKEFFTFLFNLFKASSTLLLKTVTDNPIELSLGFFLKFLLFFIHTSCLYY